MSTQSNPRRPYRPAGAVEDLLSAQIRAVDEAAADALDARAARDRTAAELAALEAAGDADSVDDVVRLREELRLRDRKVENTAKSFGRAEDSLVAAEGRALASLDSTLSDRLLDSHPDLIADVETAGAAFMIALDRLNDEHSTTRGIIHEKRRENGDTQDRNRQRPEKSVRADHAAIREIVDDAKSFRYAREIFGAIVGDDGTGYSKIDGLRVPYADLTPEQRTAVETVATGAGRGSAHRVTLWKLGHPDPASVPNRELRSTLSEWKPLPKPRPKPQPKTEEK